MILDETALARDRIVCAALCLGTTIIVGPRHFDQIMRTQIAYLPVALQNEFHLTVPEQGFVTQHGRFVGREEAWRIAEAAGQIFARCGGDGEQLFSENLY